jgi:hypothetical protein
MERLGNVLLLIAVFAGWFVLNRFLLPRAGVST